MDDISKVAFTFASFVTLILWYLRLIREHDLRYGFLLVVQLSTLLLTGIIGYLFMHQLLSLR